MALDVTLGRVVPLIYEIPTSPEAWTAVGAALQQLLRARTVEVAHLNFKSQETSVRFNTGYLPEFVDSYEEYYAKINPWLRDAAAFRVPGTIHLGEELVSDAELLGSEFYHDWLKPQRLLHRMSAVLTREGDGLCYLAVFRSPQEQPFGPDDKVVLAVLVPHLRRALQLRDRLIALERERRAALGVLDHLPMGVILCDGDGTAMVINESAGQTLAAGDALELRSNRLWTQRRDEMTTLDHLIAGATSASHGNGLASSGALSITRRSGGRPLSVLVSPLRGLWDGSRHSRVGAAVFIGDPDSVSDPNEEWLGCLYGLTPSESRVAAQILHGKSLEEAADALSITIGTARSYMKRVLCKTGVRRQAQLVRLLLLLPAPLVPAR